MKAGERTSPRFYDTASTICRSTDFPAQSTGRGSPKARLRGPAKSLATLLVDLLLDILLCLLRIRDDAPDDPEASADSPDIRNHRKDSGCQISFLDWCREGESNPQDPKVGGF